MGAVARRCVIPILTLSYWTAGSRSTRSEMPQSNGYTPECDGLRGRPGAAPAATLCGATFLITFSTAGCWTTVISALFATHPTIAMAIRLIGRAGSFHANTLLDVSCATNTTAPLRL